MDFSKLLVETTVKATTSGGKGGQNVNKVATRVELYFDVIASPSLNDNQKKELLNKLKHRINSEGVLRITASEKRSQLENRDLAKQKFISLLQKALQPRKKRRATAPSMESKEARLRKKKLISEKKRVRAGSKQRGVEE